jgi:hypothetical protein
VFQSAVQDIEQAALRQGLDPNLHPKTTAVLARLSQAGSTGAIGISEIETLRRVVGQAARSTDPAEQSMALMLRDGIDDLMERLRPSDILGGSNPQATIDALRSARDMWGRARKSELIDELVEKARNAVGANYTQAGMLTALRQQFRALANGPRFNTFTPDEKMVILHIVRGGSMENMLRWMGKFSLRNPLMAAIAGGSATMGQLLPAALMAGAEGARAASGIVGQRSVGQLSDLVRRGGQQAVSIPPAVQYLFDQAGSAGGRATAVNADETVPPLLPGLLAPRVPDPRWRVQTVPVAP